MVGLECGVKGLDTCVDDVLCYVVSSHHEVDFPSLVIISLGVEGVYFSGYVRMMMVM